MRTRSLHAPTLLVAALAALSACGDDRGLNAPPSRPAAAISDGAHAGGVDNNDDFFFLPPLVPNPASHENFDSGKFSGFWKPVVEICELGGTPAACVGAVHRYEGDAVTLSIADEHYAMHWDTREPWAVVGKTYRAHVVLEGTTRKVLGFVDLALLATQQAVKNAQSGDIVPLQDGRTLPIKFRIEEGATAGGSTDFTEEPLTSTGGTVAANQAGITFDPGFLPPGVDEVVVTVQRTAATTGEQCHEVAGLRILGSCYRIETYPDIGVLRAPAVVAICVTNPSFKAQSMFKSDPGRVKELEDVAVPESLADALQCDEPPPVAFGGGLRGRFLAGIDRALRGIGRAITPRSAYAIDFGAGGQLRALEDDLSDFSFGVPTRIDFASASGDGQSGAPGALLPETLRVRVTSAHDEHDVAAPPLADVPVTFVIASGAGILNAPPTPPSGTGLTLTVLTDADGIAEAQWTLGAGLGLQSVVASVPEDSSRFNRQKSVTFTATAAINDVVLLSDGEPVASIVIDEGAQRIFTATPNFNGTPAGIPCDFQSLAPNTVGAASGNSTAGQQMVVTGLAPGEGQVRVACGNYEETVNVTVRRLISITDLETNANIVGTTVQMVANTRLAWRATVPATSTSCQLSPAVGDAVMYAYWTRDELGQLYVNVEARSAGTRTVSVTCGTSTASFGVDIAAAPLTVAASCGPEGYATGDLIERGFYLANYPDVLLAGANLQFSAAEPGTYTLTLTARLGTYDGAVLGTSSTTVTLGGRDTKTLGVFRWPSVVVPRNATVAFSITQQTPGSVYYSVYQSFAGDASCSLMETEGTTAPLDQDRRRGVEATIYSALGPSY